MTVRETIDRWFAQHLRVGALARDTEAYNQVFVAVENLKDALDPRTPEPAPAPAPSTGEPLPETPATISAKE